MEPVPEGYTELVRESLGEYVISYKDDGDKVKVTLEVSPLGCEGYGRNFGTTYLISKSDFKGTEHTFDGAMSQIKERLTDCVIELMVSLSKDKEFRS